MAGRVTQLALEVLAEPTTQKAQVTQLALEVLAQPTTQLARVTQLALEVLIEPLSYVPLTIETSDSLNNWNDILVTLSLGLLTTTSNDSLSFTDEILVETYGNLEIQVDSAFLDFLDDVGTPEVFGILSFDTIDTLELSDTFEKFSIWELYFEDTLTLTDSATIPREVRIYEDLNNWLDNYTLLMIWSLQFSDLLVLGDRATLFYLRELTTGDSFTLSDLIKIIQGYYNEQTDSIEYFDDSIVEAYVNQTDGLADSLTLSDGVSIYLSDYEDDYYRRYLQDRNMMIGDMRTYWCDAMSFSDSVVVGIA